MELVNISGINFSGSIVPIASSLGRKQLKKKGQAAIELSEPSALHFVPRCLQSALLRRTKPRFGSGKCIASTLFAAGGNNTLIAPSGLPPTHKTPDSPWVPHCRFLYENYKNLKKNCFPMPTAKKQISDS